MGSLHVVSHPLIETKLTRMRDRATPPSEFRRLLYEISLLLAYEATRGLPTSPVRVETPLCAADGSALEEDAVTIVPILRAGLGLVEGFLTLMPSARVGHIGLARDEATHEPHEYYYKMPEGVERSAVIVVDPMLATGGSAVDALSSLKARGCVDLRLVNLVAAPEGVEAVRRAHPDVDLYVAAVDEGLNEDAYIVPGLGDAGDRIFGTA